MSKLSATLIETFTIYSLYLKREVVVDVYLPPFKLISGEVDLLLINDGQDLPKFEFDKMLDVLFNSGEIRPLLCIGIHCGKERKMEYGIAGIPDYKKRGLKAAAHQQFVFDELLPYIRSKYCSDFREKSYAGFSLGGLTAIDVVWNHPHEFVKAGVFSGSLWWRSKDIDDGYNEDTDRIMHRQIRDGNYAPWLKFYFTTGSLDETIDRNNNGIIDSIDDTVALIDELYKKGYSKEDIKYINYEDGKHDVPTWGRAMPDFLKWGWGVNRETME